MKAARIGEYLVVFVAIVAFLVPFLPTVGWGKGASRGGQHPTPV
jgi:hypothetical protein